MARPKKTAAKNHHKKDNINKGKKSNPKGKGDQNAESNHRTAWNVNKFAAWRRSYQIVKRNAHNEKTAEQSRYAAEHYHHAQPRFERNQRIA